MPKSLTYRFCLNTIDLAKPFKPKVINVSLNLSLKSLTVSLPSKFYRPIESFLILRFQCFFKLLYKEAHCICLTILIIGLNQRLRFTKLYSSITLYIAFIIITDIFFSYSGIPEVIPAGIPEGRGGNPKTLI